MIDHVNVPKTAKPVFVKAECLPNKTSVVELLDTVLAVIGRGTIAAAWKQSGTWLIYPWTEEARAKMVTNIYSIHGKQFELDGNDPSHIPAVGEFKPRTKLTVSNLPLEVSNPNIGKCLAEAGFVLRSPVKHDVIKTSSGDEAMGGKRFVYIDLPQKKTSKFLKIGKFTAFLFFKEMEDTKATCRQCLQPGHRAKDCTNDPVCYTCKKPGHKRGDPRCDLGNEAPEEIVPKANSTFIKEFGREFDRVTGVFPDKNNDPRMSAFADNSTPEDRSLNRPVQGEVSLEQQHSLQENDVLSGGGEDVATGNSEGEPNNYQGSLENDNGARSDLNASSRSMPTPNSAIPKLFSEVAASTPAKKDSVRKLPHAKPKSKEDTPTSKKGFLQTHIDKFGALKRRLGDRSPPSPSTSQEDGSAKRPARP